MDLTRGRREYKSGPPGHRMAGALAVLGIMLWTQACATRTVYRPTFPPPAASTPRPAPPPDYYPPPAPQPRSGIESGPIREEDLKERRAAPQPQQEQSARSLPPAPAPPRTEEVSLLGKITASTPPQRAASLRLTEEGRKLLEAGEHAKALSRLEKTIAIDSTNPYGYYFLAKAHFYLGRHQQSLRFLDVAEGLLAGDPYWLSELFALRGEDYRALGSLDRADFNYSQALRLNPGNRTAADGLSRIQGETRPGLR